MFLAVVCFILLKTFSDYGLSWDEAFRASGGEQKLAYYLALTQGDFEGAADLRSAGDTYPGLFDLSLALLRRVSSFDDVSVGHFWSSCFGLIGILGAMFLGRRLGGPWVGLLAGIFLALCPRYWGHMFINPKDIPFAATFIWGIWAICRTLTEPNDKWIRSSLIFGLTAGACMSVRVGGLLLFCYAGLFLGLGTVWRWWEGERTLNTLMRRALRLMRWLLVAGAMAFLILFAFWPSMHVNPFATTATTLGEVTHFNWQGMVLFQGELLSAAQIPWNYLLVWLMISLPEVWFFILLSGLLMGVCACIANRSNGLPSFVSAAPVLALSFMAVFPLAYILCKESTVYDGMRHILFILPIIAVILACIANRVACSLRSPLRLVWWAIIVAGLLATIVQQLRLHPYQYIYFNRIAGGVQEASLKYDTDYWGTAYREGLELMVERVPPKTNGGNWRITMEPPMEVLIERIGKPVVPPPALVEPYLRDDFILVRGHESPELYIATTRNAYNAMRPGDVLDQVQREGAVLLEIKLLRREGTGGH